MQGVNFVAIDFETATARRDSICEAGICVVRNGKVIETRSWLVQPQGNQYNYYNIQVHGIKPQDTAHAPLFPEVWSQILPYIQESPILVAHNAAFDMSCIRSALSMYDLDTPAITYYCTLRAARRLYDFECNKLDALCHVFDIPCLNHHRAGDDAEMCARIFLRQLKDAGHCTPEQMDFCQGTL